MKINEVEKLQIMKWYELNWGWVTERYEMGLIFKAPVEQINAYSLSDTKKR
jgi:hypothetical protein